MSVAAFFDVDGTITRTILLDPLIWYQKARLPAWRYALWASGLALKLPGYVLLDRRSRSAFNVVFFKRYAGYAKNDLIRFHRESFAATLQQRIFPPAADAIRKHKEQGHHVVLVTGGIDFVVQPLAEMLGADYLYAMQLVDKEGTLTGECGVAPLADEEKARLIGQYAATHGIDLAKSYGYGNNWGDAAMMALTGHPVAVNPDSRLRKHADKLQWTTVTWR